MTSSTTLGRTAVATRPAVYSQHAHAVVREGINNTVRHANASDLTITVSVGDDPTITITDDGIGIGIGVGIGQTTPAAACTTSPNAPRAPAAPATSPAPTRGTRVTWTAPLT